MCGAGEQLASGQGSFLLWQILSSPLMDCMGNAEGSKYEPVR